MAGLIAIGIVVAYVTVFWFVIAKARNLGERVAAVVVALLIPFWDLPIGLFKFHQYCSEEGGVHIDKDLRPTNSMLVEEGSGIRPVDALKLGFKTVEYMSRDGVVRYSMSESGLSKTLQKVPVSSLKYQFLGQQLLPWNLTRTEYVITRLVNGRVVARQTDFGWRGMWWEVATRIHVTSANSCGGVFDRPLLSYVVA